LDPYHRPLIVFSGEKVYPLGTIKLEVFLGTWPTSRIEKVHFFVKDKNVQFAYNVIMVRVGLKKFEVVPSTVHQCLKFPTNFGVGVIKGDQKVARECYYSSAGQEDLEELKKNTNTYQVDTTEPNSESEVETLDPREETELVKGHIVEATESIILDDDKPERITQIGSTMDLVLKQELLTFTRQRKNVFA